MEPNKKSNEIQTELIKEFPIKVEKWKLGVDMASGDDVTMTSVYTHDGKYVGSLKDSQFLFDKGIMPETYEDNKVCSIGKSHIDGKWYGWSHRAIYGFEIGSTVTKGSVLADYFPIGFEAMTDEEAKRMAIEFARSVS